MKREPPHHTRPGRPRRSPRDRHGNPRASARGGCQRLARRIGHWRQAEWKLEIAGALREQLGTQAQVRAGELRELRRNGTVLSSDVHLTAIVDRRSRRWRRPRDARERLSAAYDDVTVRDAEAIIVEAQAHVPRSLWTIDPGAQITITAGDGETNAIWTARQHQLRCSGHLELCLLARLARRAIAGRPGAQITFSGAATHATGVSDRHVRDLTELSDRLTLSRRLAGGLELHVTDAGVNIVRSRAARWNPAPLRELVAIAG